MGNTERRDEFIERVTGSDIEGCVPGGDGVVGGVVLLQQDDDAADAAGK
jgi:hypothetical protein